jgi:hypothetical protein
LTPDDIEYGDSFAAGHPYEGDNMELIHQSDVEAGIAL